MRRSVVLLCCLLTAACSREAESPFVQMSLDAALARAGDEGKVVFVDFTATWCEPCQRLKRTTFRDAAVREWLQERTIALQVDIDEHADLAKEFNVRSVPTLVFLKPDRSVLGTIVGFRDASAFLDVAPRRLRGESALDEAQATLAAKPGDSTALQDAFRQLVAAGRQQEATEVADEYWESSREDPAQAGVRASFFVSEMGRLAEGYAPARELMDRWGRDASAGIGQGGMAGVTYALELAALATTLDEPRLVLDAADELEPGRALRALITSAAGVFVEAQRYEQMVDSGACEPGEVKERYEIQENALASLPESAASEMLEQTGRDLVLRPAVHAFEALGAVGRTEDAMKVAGLVLGGDDDAQVRERLAKAAERADVAELATKVRGER